LQFQVEGAVVGGALAGGAVQPVGQPEGGLDEGQRLETEKPELPLIAQRRAGFKGPVRAEAGVAHLDEPDATEIGAGAGHLLRGGRRPGGDPEGEPHDKPPRSGSKGRRPLGASTLNAHPTAR
jgi:hypothetical protein